MSIGADTAARKSTTNRRKSSLAVKVLQVAALAAVLVPLGTVAVETTSMTFCGSGSSLCTPTATNDYLFGDFAFTLTFEGLNPTANFFVDVTIAPYDTLAMLARPLPTPYECVPLDLGYPTPQCWELFIDPSVTQPGNWDTWVGTVSWLNNTDSQFPDPRFFHYIGGSYQDITIPGSHNEPPYPAATPPGGDPSCYPYCSFLPEGDPTISGRDNDFSPALVGGLGNTAAVPEPASLVLVGTGVAGYLYRRRRRSPTP
jgi:hypothetical protein